MGLAGKGLCRTLTEHLNHTHFMAAAFMPVHESNPLNYCFLNSFLYKNEILTIVLI